MNNSALDINPTAQLMFIQSRAHHEDRIIHTKPTIDNRLRDFSHLLNPTFPSKKNYINKEKIKKINQENTNLLSKIYKITFDKNIEPATKKAVPAKKTRREEGTSIELHPFSSDHRSRSLNNANRRKELEKINKDNSQLLYKLRTMKPTVPDVGQCKQRKKKLDYLKNLIHRRDDEQQNRVLHPYISQRMKGDSILNQYIQRHEQVGRRSSITTNYEGAYVTNEVNESGANFTTKKGRRHKRTGSRENMRGSNLNSSEIIIRGAEPDSFDNSNYQSNPTKKMLLPEINQNVKKKGLEDIDKKMNLNTSQEVPAKEADITEEIEGSNGGVLKSIRENDIKEEISHGGDSTNREAVKKSPTKLNPL